tara:strand:+ start:3902 stop:4141 length:240 start_codon:yes stop_codon:yes gene_type:complete
MSEVSDKEKTKRIKHFRKVIYFRSLLGWVFAGVGICLFGVEINDMSNPLILINGLLFFGYGLFMVWQTKKAKANLDGEG